MWPIALWALYSWRRQLDRTQILLPSLFLAAIVFAGFFIRYDAAGNLLLISMRHLRAGRLRARESAPLT